MRLRDADLSGLWEGVHYHYERLGRPVPRRWRLLYCAVRWLLMRGAW